MNNDFRLQVNVLDHIKIRRLIAKHGNGAFVGLVRLWAYAATTENSNGEFVGMESSDIAMIAEVENSDFGENLLELRLLDITENGYAIHNWKRHNPYCCESKKRTESAANAAKIRWSKNSDKSKKK